MVSVPSYRASEYERSAIVSIRAMPVGDVNIDNLCAVITVCLDTKKAGR